MQWPPGQDEPGDYWLSDLLADTPLSDLVHLAKSRWRIEQDYRERKTGLGLDHIEGRSFIGSGSGSAHTATNPSPPNKSYQACAKP